MAKSFKEYRSEIVSIDDYPPVIESARKEYNVTLGTPLTFQHEDIPLNLEREFYDALLEADRVEEAKNVLERMRISYTNDISHNIIESYEYRLRTIELIKKLTKDELAAAKKDFNQHTITIVSIIVGVITILGAANQVFPSMNPPDALGTFFAICLSIITLVFVALALNSYRSKK